MVSRFLLSI